MAKVTLVRTQIGETRPSLFTHLFFQIRIFRIIVQFLFIQDRILLIIYMNLNTFINRSFLIVNGEKKQDTFNPVCLRQ